MGDHKGIAFVCAVVGKVAAIAEGTESRLRLDERVLGIQSCRRLDSRPGQMMSLRESDCVRLDESMGAAAAISVGVLTDVSPCWSLFHQDPTGCSHSGFMHATVLYGWTSRRTQVTITVNGVCLLVRFF